MKKVAFYTLGCKVNKYESQAMCELFEKAGYEQTDFCKKADVYIVNTCSVTSLSDRKSRQIIRRAKRLNPDAVLIVTGCYAQVSPDEAAKIEGVNLIIGTNGRKNIVQLAEQAANESTRIEVSDIMRTHDFEEMSIHTYSDRTRACIKIQEGCSQFCSYCIIPYARGPIRSRSEDSVISEAKRLSEEGFCEVVLVGIHVASYGKDLKNTSLSKIITKIAEIDKIKRIRLSSIEPMTLDEKFFEAVKGAGKKLCHHFHISLQSGCDETLARMNRKYTSHEFEQIVHTIRTICPDAAVTTDVMVGFPGESEDEFEKSFEFVKKIGFADLHVFQYSPRPKTPAAEMDFQISPEIKHKRSEIMIAEGTKSRDRFLKRFLKKELEVLFEQEHKEKKGFYEGKTKNYITAVCESKKDISGKIVNIKADEIKDGVIYGHIIDEEVAK